MGEDAVRTFARAMDEVGLHRDLSIVANASIRRFRPPSDKRPNSWYVLNHNRTAAGAFGSLRTNATHKCYEGETRRP
jgi:hypothetical protein